MAIDQKVLGGVRAIASLTTRISGLAVVALAVAITVDVLYRKFVGKTLMHGGIGEISGYALAIVTAWGASATLLARSHIRVDTLNTLVPRRAARILDIVAIAAFALTSIVLAVVAYSTVARTVQLSSHSMTPLAVPMVIPQALWFAGLVFLALTSVVLLIFGTLAILRGQNAKAHELIGARSVTEEIEEQKAILADQPEGGIRI